MERMLGVFNSGGSTGGCSGCYFVIRNCRGSLVKLVENRKSRDLRAKKGFVVSICYSRRVLGRKRNVVEEVVVYCLKRKTQVHKNRNDPFG